MKTCTKCGVEKPSSEFSRDKRAKDGLQSWCKSCKNQARKEWREANPEKNREDKRKWYAANSEKEVVRNREWRAANPDSGREYYAANAEKKCEYNREYQRANLDKRAVNNHNYRARKAGAEGSHTAEDVAAMFRRWPNCLCCGTDEDRTVDHVVSLDAGGSDWPSNLQTLCGSCNSSKGTATVDYRQGASR